MQVQPDRQISVQKDSHRAQIPSQQRIDCDINDRRMPKQEILRCHYAQPVLVKSLLLAAEIQQGSNTNPHALSVHFIIDLCKFQQKMKWLCPWGPELFDETNRIPGFLIPPEFRAKQMDIESKKITSEKNLRRDRYRNLLSDAKQSWDRVFMDKYDPEAFTHLHLHPCEELHLRFPENVSIDDIQHIVRCKTLKNIFLRGSSIDLKHLNEFKRLPALEKLMYFHSSSGHSSITRLKNFPKVNLLPIQQNLLKISASGIEKINHAVESMRDRIRHVHLECPPLPSLSAVLSRCDGIKSILLCDAAMYMYDPSGIEDLFRSAFIQRSVQSIMLNAVDLTPHTFTLMARCTKLRWFRVAYDSWVNSTFISPIIQANRTHLVKVTIMGCRYVDEAILEAIACCWGLKCVILCGNAPRLVEAVRRYKAEQRPNWRALSFGDDSDE